MSINVYWSFIDDEWMRAVEPQEVRKEFYSRGLHENNAQMSFNKCPFTHEHLNNIFSLHSVYDYKFRIDGASIFSEMHDQNFFDNHVIIRSLEKKAFSFMQPFIFFTEEESLVTSLPEFPYLENNNITKRCMPFVGTIDIGKYFRTLDFGFFLKNEYDEFIIEKGEVFGYVNFHTDKKIQFKEFYPTDNIKKYAHDVRNATKNKKNNIFLKPETYYSKFKLKKLILKEIKNNLL